MASPFSGLVLAASAALTSPTLHAAFIAGTVPVEDALLRFVTAVAITTVAITLVQWLFHGTSPRSDPALGTTEDGSTPGVAPGPGMSSG